MAEQLADESPAGGLWPSERLISDAVGRLMAFWGFKRNMGRLWSVLYLADEPLSAQALRQRLNLSAGAVSMGLSELAGWGVVQKVWMKGQRRDYFVAEGRFWKMISRVLREREFVEVLESIASLEQAVALLDERLVDPDPRVRAQARGKRARAAQLLDLARLGRSLLEMLLRTGRVDALPLSLFELGRR